MTYDDYFRGPYGTRYSYAEIADRIRKEAPHTLGKHISVQLEAIGLLDEMRNGTTPCGLPFTFADAAEMADAERQRKAVPTLLAALNAVLPYAWNERASLRECWERDGDPKVKAELEACDRALDRATAAIAEAKASGTAPATGNDQRPRFEIDHDPEENPDRVYVLVDGQFDVAIIRTDEGVVIDVYPKDGFETIATTYAFDSDADKAEEA